MGRKKGSLAVVRSSISDTLVVVWLDDDEEDEEEACRLVFWVPWDDVVAMLAIEFPLEFSGAPSREELGAATLLRLLEPLVKLKDNNYYLQIELVLDEKKCLKTIYKQVL